ncbi:hypothetical protein T8S45_07015 [Blastomonas marina]|uniref:hypothetical protein n=1 Tax=Blastomonas marina TaxID=1867408 RepID=UPI002AC98E51|nr:hypothetical protein [Blastomonas marina]WPZ02607.1 hypothetical protein T8S45_07015 [Blastomonas marina]
MFRIRLLATLATGAMLVAPIATHAREAGDQPRLLSDEEMSDARGGFTINGLEIRLGAEMRTYLGGELVLRTIVSWEDSGPQSEQWASPLLHPVDAAAMRAGLLANGNLQMSVNSQPVFLTNEGQTALLQRVDGRLQNMIFNTASGTDLRQEAEISLSIANYQDFRTAMAPAIMMSGLADAIAQSALSSIGR